MTTDATEVVWEEGYQRLKADPAFASLVRQVGPVRIPARSGNAFSTLFRAIVYQQLAGKAAATIHERAVEALAGAVRPEVLLDTAEADLRGAGLSRSKLRAARDLAGRIVAGRLDLEALPELPDEAVEEELIQVWGIGRWTARMFLLFDLTRPDVWPVGDLGVRQGWARIHGMEEAPDAKALQPLGDPYRPWRSVVAWYCWRAMDVLPPGATPSDSAVGE
ncbi:MAG: DNA-3-methyladenine glycosylase family protein [bacterium]